MTGRLLACRDMTPARKATVGHLLSTDLAAPHGHLLFTSKPVDELGVGDSVTVVPARVVIPAQPCGVCRRCRARKRWDAAAARLEGWPLRYYLGALFLLQVVVLGVQAASLALLARVLEAVGQ